MRYKKDIIPTILNKESILLTKLDNDIVCYENVKAVPTGNKTDTAFEVTKDNYETWIMIPKSKRITFEENEIILDYGRIKQIIKY